MKNINDKDFQNRRDFLKKSGIFILSSPLITSQAWSKSDVSTGNVLKIGLIGCGGRGTGAAIQALEADKNTVITAMGDVFEDRLEEAYAALKEVNPDRVKVAKDKKFVGFDAYLKVMNSDVDVVLLTTPPGFRPLHFEAAVKAKKHIFCEKPVAVDAPGVRKVLAAAKKAKELNLSVVSGFCFRYDFSSRAIFGKVLDGSIGEVQAVSSFRNGGELWYKDRQPNWSEMTYQMQNWYYFNWLSGDFVVEQAVHSLDMMSWAMGDVMPLSASGTGGRQSRTDPKYGNIYDHFAVEFLYPNGKTGTHFTRQQGGATPRNTVDIIGTEGNANINVAAKYQITGKNKWTYEGEKNNMYQTQHDELFAAIRKGTAINDGEWMAHSTLLAIWTRMVGYTGLTLTFEQVLNSQESLGPDLKGYTWDLNYEMPPIARPGLTKFI